LAQTTPRLPKAETHIGKGGVPNERPAPPPNKTHIGRSVYPIPPPPGPHLESWHDSLSSLHWNVVVQPPVVVKEGAVLTIIENNVKHVRISRNLRRQEKSTAEGHTNKAQQGITSKSGQAIQGSRQVRETALGQTGPSPPPHGQLVAIAARP
jgi:hypothetical protein